MNDHRCIFDSEQGFLPQRLGLSLRCECGRWMTTGHGRLDSRPRSPEEVWVMIFAAIIFLVALWAL